MRSLRYGAFVKAAGVVRIDGTYSNDREVDRQLKTEIGSRLAHAINERRVSWVKSDDLENLVFDYLGYRYRVTERSDMDVKAVTRLGMVAATEDEGEDEFVQDTKFTKDALGEAWGAW